MYTLFGILKNKKLYEKKYFDYGDIKGNLKFFD